jgi:hypothetical protein
MGIKKEYIALFAVILALSLYLVFRTRDRTHYELPSLQKIERAEIDKIEIDKRDASIVLTREGDRWRIAPKGYPADAEKVRKILDGIGQLTLTALVSESKNYGRYDLNDEKRITIRAWSQGTLRREFAVGKEASPSRHTFVTLAGNDRVYHARGDIRGRFDQTVDQLRDKVALSFEQDEILQVELTKNGRSTVFVRKQVPVEESAGQEATARDRTESKVETKWETADGQQVDESKLKRLIGMLADLRCKSYVADRKKEDFQNPVYSILLKGTREYRLSIFAKTGEDAEGYPAISSENAYPFLLSDRQAGDIMKDPEEMAAKPEKS